MPDKLLLSDGSKLRLSDNASRLLLAVQTADSAVNARSTATASASTVTSTVTAATVATSTSTTSDG